ncbi:MAG: MerR family transcriptional regulator [Alkaliphilus sp.]|nr:MAG: MerR family transcriptional regulator [Alkaliphilus sp.]
MTGFKPHVIRFYENEFQLEIPRKENNRRFFTYKEIEELKYIKKLQEKGFTNKQIRQVLKSPKIMVDPADKTTMSLVKTKNTLVVNEESTKKDIDNDVINYLKEKLLESISALDYREEINELSKKIDDLKSELNKQSKSILLSENAELRMKMKEKSYEVAELKAKLKRETKKKTIFGKLFFNNKNNDQYLSEL